MRLDHLIHDEIRNQVSDTRLRALDDSQSAFESVDVETLAPWSYDLLMLNTSLRAFGARVDQGNAGTVADAMTSAAMFAGFAGPDDDEDDEDDDLDDDDDLDEDDEDTEDEDEEEAEEISLEEIEEKDEDDPASTDFGAMDDDDEDDISWDDDEEDDDEDDLFEDED